MFLSPFQIQNSHQAKVDKNNNVKEGTINDDDSDWLLTAKTVENDSVELLKQFEELTSGTSSGSANVISTQLKSEAPWTAVSTI